MTNDQLVAKLRDRCPEFCAALTLEEIRQFVHYTMELKLTPNTLLAEIGDVGNSFYLVLDGSVRLLQVDHPISAASHDDTPEADKHIKEFLAGEIRAGSLVGEMSFFDRRPRTLRLKTGAEGVHLLEINREMYNRLRIEESYISTNLLEFVIRSLDGLVRNLSEQNALLHSQLYRDSKSQKSQE